MQKYDFAKIEAISVKNTKNIMFKNNIINDDT